jgi:hypothetical protein
VVDDLDAVGVGVEHVRAVVARVALRALTRRAVVAVAGLRRGAMERLHGGAVVGGERHVQMLGRRAGDQAERAPGGAELRRPGSSWPSRRPACAAIVA